MQSALEYQAGSWRKARGAIAKVELHPGELFPRFGFVVTNLPMEADWIIHFYNQRGIAKQHIKEGKYPINGTRLLRNRFRDSQAREQFHTLAYNLGSFLKRTDLPEEVTDRLLTSIQSRLIKIGALIVWHARKITCQLAEVAVLRSIFGQILTAIRNLKPRPSHA